MSIECVLDTSQVSHELAAAIIMESVIDNKIREGVACDNPSMQPLYEVTGSLADQLSEQEKIIAREVGMHHWLGRMMLQDKPYEDPEFNLYVEQKRELSSAATYFDVDRQLVTRILYSLPRKDTRLAEAA